MIPRGKVITFVRQNAETGSSICMIVEGMTAPVIATVAHPFWS